MRLCNICEVTHIVQYNKEIVCVYVDAGEERKSVCSSCSDKSFSLSVVKSSPVGTISTDHG